MTTRESTRVEGLPSASLSRRRVLRAGAAVAWSVPVIQVVGAAPAYAACVSGAAAVTGAGSYAAGTDTLTVQLSNSAKSAATSVTVTVTLASKGQVDSVTSGWTNPTGNGNQEVHKFVLASLSGCSGSTASTATLVVDFRNDSSLVPVTVTVSWTGAPAAVVVPITPAA